MLLLTACAGTRAVNTPRLALDLYHTVVFKDDDVETHRYSEKPRIREFIARLNTAKPDSVARNFRGACRIYLVGSEGTQRIEASGTFFRLSGAGCRFKQSHCKYRADFDLEALCRGGGK